MNLHNFIGKVVVNPITKQRYTLSEISSPVIKAVRLTDGRSYAFPTINGDPITTGKLVFEDTSFLEPFKEAYTAFCRTKDAYWEEFEYWMRKD